MTIRVPSILLPGSKIFVVGEAPGAEDERTLHPFVGAAGHLLDGLLGEAGIPRNACSFSNVSKSRPLRNDRGELFEDKRRTQPKFELQQDIVELAEEIRRVRPNIVIACGDVALWALTGKHKITNWRGSVLESTLIPGLKVIPIYPPDSILRTFEWRWITVNDLRRAFRESHTPDLPDFGWTLHTRPSFADSISFLNSIPPGPCSVDIETRNGHIACIGVSRSPVEAMCIPLMCQEDLHGYWSLEQELGIVTTLKRVLMRPETKLIGQNWIYDLQYIARHWGFAPLPWMDTMLAHHVCFAGLPKGLDFIASMYCKNYTFWKNEGKEWHKSMNEDQLWEYNCKDVLYTHEAALVLENTIKKLDLQEPFNFQMKVFPAIFKMMLRGVKVDKSLRGELTGELFEEIGNREKLIEQLLGAPINVRSPKQLQQLFYEELGQKQIIKRATGRPTTDDEALTTLARREPLLKRLVGAINEIRYLSTSLNIVKVSLDTDEHLRCSYNIAGTTTFRLSSSEDAFGFGTNLQNVSSGRISEETNLTLPNLRRLIVPELAYIVDVDLKQADAQVVAWDADDEILKQMFRERVDVHTENAKEIGCSRKQAKAGVHATNYGASARTLAYNLGITLRQAEHFINRWFQIHPKIKRWQERLNHELQTRRYVKNAFGYRRFFFDRTDGLLPEALAWVPQSTIAILINKIMVALVEQMPEAVLRLQVHDSLTFELPSLDLLPRCTQIASIPIPYPDPLIIPVDFKESQKSWGDCK